MLDLLVIKQLINELVTDLLERFKNVKSKCNIQLPEAKYALIAVNNMHPQPRKKLIVSEYSE